MGAWSKKSEPLRRAPFEPGPGTRARRPAGTSTAIEKQHTNQRDQKKGGPLWPTPLEQEPGARTGRPAALARRLKTSTLTGAPKIREALADRRSSKDREHGQDALAKQQERLKNKLKRPARSTDSTTTKQITLGQQGIGR